MDAQSQWTGLDAGRLERIADHLERNYIGPQKIAGCQVQVARHGHIAYQKSFGSMDLERNKAMRDDAIKNRDIVAGKMTPAQIAEAQRLASAEAAQLPRRPPKCERPPTPTQM